MPRQLAKAAPELTEVIFENEKVRVIGLRVKKGSKAPLHRHPLYLVYALTRFSYISTPERGYPQHRKMKAGEVDWRDGESHEVEFTSNGRALLVELK